MTADGRKDDGHVSIDIKVRRHVTDEDRRKRDEEARRNPHKATVALQRDWNYASASESFDHVCATITRPAAK